MLAGAYQGVLIECTSRSHSNKQGGAFWFYRHKFPGIPPWSFPCKIVSP